MTMNILKASYKEIKETDISKKIEQIARVCYKSEDKIGPGTDMKMVENLKTRRHYAMLEHATLAYRVSYAIYGYVVEIVAFAMHNITDADIDSVPDISRIRYTETRMSEDPETDSFVVSGNLRAWTEFFEYITSHYSQGYLKRQNNNENDKRLLELITQVAKDSKNIVDFTSVTEGWTPCDEPDMKLITDFSELMPAERMVHETFSVLFTCDRGVTHELVRMRDCSFAQESTRYCNYANGKFGNEISVIEPVFWSSDDDTDKRLQWENACKASQDSYNQLIAKGAVPAGKKRIADLCKS